MKLFQLAYFAACLAIFGCAENQRMEQVATGSGTQQIPASPSPTPTSAPSGAGQQAQATHYGEGDGFAGKKTATGEVMNPADKTAASPNLSLGSKARVINKKTGQQTEVRINDRQPKRAVNSIDLSPAAAKAVGMMDEGKGTVEIEPISK